MSHLIRRLTWPRIAMIAALAAVAALIAVAGPAAPGRAAATRLTAAPAAATRAATAPRALAAKPTIVLVHGAWADSSSWGKVIPRLEHAGYKVVADPNPLRGLASDAAYLSAFIKGRTAGPVVLVGHSYGGAVITDAALHDPTVKALVYVDAFAPDQGQTIGQLVSSVPGSCVVAADPTTLFNLATYPGAPAGVFDAYYKQSLFPACFANGLPAAQAKVLAATQEPLSTIALGQKSGVPAWKTIPSWAVVGTADRVILPAVQLAMARHAHAHITEVRAPHLSMISAPGVVTQVILQAAHATR